MYFSIWRKDRGPFCHWMGQCLVSIKVCACNPFWILLAVYLSSSGHHFFTIGQRARIGGHHIAYFVANKDHHSNTVIVVEGSIHPALYTHSFTTSQPHWITESSPDPLHNSYEQTLECLVRTRHQQPLMKCTITTTQR